uniref:Alpha-D-phosphohexomutase alpha/beta/alpha domain-containing protein n=1 Tax=Pavo cristatus TaxID=9049 RepID=A0A8C9F1C9_PAVCR
MSVALHGFSQSLLTDIFCADCLSPDRSVWFCYRLSCTDFKFRRWSKMKELVAEGNVGELQKYFGSRMEFGTAGLRAAMGAGISHMNDLTIIQTTQGFCRYLEKNFSDLKKRGVVIGFDARAHLSSGGSSKRFARLAANTFISQGVPVYLFSDITPTPFVPYTVTHLKLCAGIMVTASHNPKQDNGYKVFLNDLFFFIFVVF